MAPSMLSSLIVLALSIHGVFANGAGGRALKAAALHSDIAKRSYEIPIRQNLRMDYIEDIPFGAERVGASVDLRAKSHGTLLLEEIEHMLEEVHCEAGYLDLKFASEHFANVRGTLDQQSELIVITSHYGCNDAGSRFPYRVVEKTFSDDSCTGRLKLDHSSWRKDFKLDVRFGPEDRNRYSLNQHDHLRRRQDKRQILDAIDSVLPFDFPSPTVSQAITRSGDYQITFPTPTDAAEANSTVATADISNTFDGAQLFPPIEAQGILANINPLQLPGVEVICAECRTFGEINLESGFFSTEESEREATDFITDGFVSIRASGLAAQMGLELRLQPEMEIPLEIDLISIPLTPLAIPGIANIGVTFTPRVILAATVQSDTSFTYGFNATVPDNSTAIASFGEPTDSIALGFDGTAVEALPFNANVSTIAGVRLALTFQPEISLGIDILDQLIGAAFFINMPEVAVTFAAVNGTDSNCEPLNGTSSVGFGPLLHIEPKVILAAGFVIGAGDVLQTEWTPLATTFALPTQCLSFVDRGSSFTPATAAASPTGIGGVYVASTTCTTPAPTGGVYTNTTSGHDQAPYPTGTGTPTHGIGGNDHIIAVGQAALPIAGIQMKIKAIAFGLVISGLFMI